MLGPLCKEGSHAWYCKPDQNPTAREVIGHSHRGESTTVWKVAAELLSKAHVNTHQSQLSAVLTLVQKLVSAMGRHWCRDSKPVKALRIMMVECSALNRTSVANPTLKALGIPQKWAKRI